jgi:hypothetical protein
VPLFAPAGKRNFARNHDGVGCGGGFVPQSLIDSSELIDSTMVRSAKKGYKGKFFIQFSFSIGGSAVLPGCGLS